MNVYTKEFVEEYEPYSHVCYEHEVKQVKKDLKDRGFQVIRTRWRSSLGCYAVEALRYKHGTPDKERLTQMRKWCTIS